MMLILALNCQTKTHHHATKPLLVVVNMGSLDSAIEGIGDGGSSVFAPRATSGVTRSLTR